MTAVATRPKKRSVVRVPASKFETIQDVLDDLGGVPAERVHLYPWPGTATQRDLWNPRVQPRKAICELVDGILAEKSVGFQESRFATILAGKLCFYLEGNNLGAATAGGNGYIKLKRKLIRVPDLSFVRWDRMPEGRTPTEPCPELVADLIVEVLSRGNTRKEMARKRREFFESGTKLFWIVDPRKQIVTVYHSAEEDGQELGMDDYVDGEEVLPGFRLSIRTWFELVTAGAPPASKSSRNR